MPRPIGYQPSPETIERKRASRAETQRVREEAGLTNSTRPKFPRSYAVINGRQMKRPDPSESGVAVLTVEEWKAALKMQER